MKWKETGREEAEHKEGDMGSWEGLLLQKPCTDPAAFRQGEQHGWVGASISRSQSFGFKSRVLLIKSFILQLDKPWCSFCTEIPYLPCSAQRPAPHSVSWPPARRGDQLQNMCAASQVKSNTEMGQASRMKKRGWAQAVSTQNVEEQEAR